jgi:lysophospholipase L1-like esterase
MIMSLARLASPLRSAFIERMGRRLPAVCLVVASLGAGCSNGSGPTAPSGAPSAGSTVIYTAIGASDAIGYGSSVACLPFASDCTNGMGYVQLLTRQLQGQGMTVTLRNLGIPGAVIGPGVQALAAQYNHPVPANFIDAEVPFVPRDSTLVTIFAGGNDVNTVGSAIRGGAGGSDATAFVDQQIRAFGTEYGTLISGIRGRAPSARIVVANLPNFAAIPMTAGYSRQDRELIQRISVGFSTQVINPLTSQGISVVDLLCNPRFADPGVFSADGFHPNDSGYAILAAEMLRAVTSSGVTTPSASCAQMQVVY